MRIAPRITRPPKENIDFTFYGAPLALCAFGFAEFHCEYVYEGIRGRRLTILFIMLGSNDSLFTN